jgi:hypothetical protein
MSESNDDLTTGIGKGLRYNQGKLRYDLVHAKAERDMVDVLTYGASKYSPDNWRQGMSWKSIIASLKRHLAAIELGEDYDNGEGGSGKLHVSNLACNAHFLNGLYYDFPQGDDRYKSYLKIPKIGWDIDGVLANFMKAWHLLHPEVLEFPTTWYTDRHIRDRFDAMKIDGTLDAFYLNMETEIKAEELLYDPHCYITSRPVKKEVTEQWLDKNHFPSKPVYTLETRQSKVDLAKEAGVEIFIDDSFDNFVDLNNHGVFTYLLTTPWNIRHDVGHMRINSINDIPWLRK